jgi:hypothetical protein
MARRYKPKRPKRVSYELIARDSLVGAPMYALLDELVNTHHQDLVHARIGLAWCTSWKPDVDGRVTLGKCKKASDLDREVAAFDFVILLSAKFWQDMFTTQLQRRALLDHELMHAAVAHDKSGEPLYDERGRRVYRMRRHDLEEFSVIAERYGCYKRDIEHFAQSLDKSRASSTAFIGRETVRRRLATAGLIVPVDAIMHWTDAERREAYVWAGLDTKARESSPAPAHVLAGSETSQKRPDTPLLSKAEAPESDPVNA